MNFENKSAIKAIVKAEEAEESSVNGPKFNRIAVVGGTHGNELTGIALIKQWQRNPEHLMRSAGDISFEIELLLANVKAIDGNRRYLDRDLNRCFQNGELDDGRLTAYEECRAKAINQQIGYAGESQVDFVIDLHTTTSNMGSTVVITSLDPVTFQLAAYLSAQIPDLKIFYESVDQASSPYLISLGRLGGVLIEVGPTPQGLLRADIFQKTEQALQHTLNFFEKFNQNACLDLPDTLTAYQYDSAIEFPKTEAGELDGMIHESLQDSDFCPLKAGDPIFRTFTGEEVRFDPKGDGKDALFYPAFINEAAYYDRLKAISLLKKVQLTAGGSPKRGESV